MKKLTLYILIQLFFTVIAVTFVLTSITWLAQTLRYIELIANNGIPFKLFVEMVFYLLPNFVVIVLPIAFLIGVIFVYNKLVTDHELVVMQAAGISHWQIAKPAFALSVFFMAFLYFFTLYFLPFSLRKYGDLSASLRQHSLVSLVSVGQFDTFGKHTVYARSQDRQGNFLGILIYDASRPDKSVTFMAEKGIVFDRKEGEGLLLMNGNRQEMDMATGKPSILYFDQYTIETHEKNKNSSKNDRFLKTYERSVVDLFNPEESLAPAMRLEFLCVAHQRLITPLYVVAFGLLGVCFMILGHFNRRGRAGKILMACAIATILEVGIMISLHNLSHLNLMILLSYGFVMAAIVIPLLLLSPLADAFFNMSWPGRRS